MFSIMMIVLSVYVGMSYSHVGRSYRIHSMDTVFTHGIVLANIQRRSELLIFQYYDFHLFRLLLNSNKIIVGDDDSSHSSIHS